jgi:glycosyltransferase involved in cell wall biosynthesis
MIMHVITNFTHSEGAQRMLMRLLERDGEERVMVVSLLEVSDKMRELSKSRDVSYIPLRMSSTLGLLRGLHRLKNLMLSENPKVIVLWMYHAMVAGTLAAKWAGSRSALIWNVRQSLDDPSSLSRSTRSSIALAKILSRYSDGIIYNSSRSHLLHTRYGFWDRNATVIHNGFELPSAYDIRPRRAKTFGVAARFHAQKDYANFFRAASRVLTTHPDTHFVAAGRGVSWQNSEVAALAQSAGISSEALDLRGEVADMANFYQSIDALVLPSRTEGFPNVLGEAMSYGRPVVTTDVGDAAIVASDAGFVVPPRDDAALSIAMRKMLDLSPAEYASYAKRARERVEHLYSIDLITQQYRDFLAASSATEELRLQQND